MKSIIINLFKFLLFFKNLGIHIFLWYVNDYMRTFSVFKNPDGFPPSIILETIKFKSDIESDIEHLTSFVELLHDLE